jgi:hypothetical protein
VGKPAVSGTAARSLFGEPERRTCNPNGRKESCDVRVTRRNRVEARAGEGPVASLLAATDKFIESLQELRENIDEFEREMRAFRKALAEGVRDREVE